MNTADQIANLTDRGLVEFIRSKTLPEEMQARYFVAALWEKMERRKRDGLKDLALPTTDRNRLVEIAMGGQPEGGEGE